MQECLIVILCCLAFTHSSELIVNPHNFKYVINNPNLCDSREGRPIDLLIWVHSGPANLRKRNAMRETWANPRHIPNALSSRIVFFMGSPTERDVQHGVLYEAELYRDIVQEDYLDSYRNLTYKAMSGLKWLDRYCKNVRIILKSDDDMVVSMDRLVKHLEVTIAFPKAPTTNSILCDVWKHRGVERSIGMKWSVSRQEYARDFYPTYCPGLALLMSPDLVHNLYSKALRTPYFWVDDVFFTGLITEHLNITWHPLGSLFHYGGKTLVDMYIKENSDFIFGHVFAYKTDIVYYIWNVFTEVKESLFTSKLL